MLNHQGNANQNNPELLPHTIRMAKIKNSGDSKCMLGCGERGTLTPSLLVGLQAFTTTLEISLAVSQKIGQGTTVGSRNTAPGHISRRSSNT